MLDAIADTGGSASRSRTTTCSPRCRVRPPRGRFLCPEGAAGVAAVRRLRESGWLAASDEVVVLNTGAGMKYPDTVAADPPVLRPGALPPR